MNKNNNLLPAISETEIETISVYGARVHNLQNIEIHIPRNQLVVITGISGSGKSSLAFDTIYAEGQRRYMDSFSNYARQFVGAFDRPDVDKITGLSPVISIEQKTTNRNPRSTVGTVTEIYDFLRLLFARIGQAYSYETGKRMVRFSERQIANHIIHNYVGRKIILLAPVVRGRKGHYRELFTQIKKQGFLKVRIDGEIQDIKAGMQVDRFKIHDIEIVVDRLKISGDLSRLSSSIDTSLSIGNGLMQVMDYETNEVKSYSKHLMCETTGISYQEPSPNSFSFNSPYGACKSCNGLGTIQEIDLQLVIPDYNTTIANDGIPPIGKDKKSYTRRKIQEIADAFDFSLFTPINEISSEALQLILHGSKAKDKAAAVVQKHNKNGPFKFEGILPILNRSYHDSSSDRLRKWAEGFMSITTCPECKGQRLNKESLHFKINNRNISDVSANNIDELFEWIASIHQSVSERDAIVVKDVLKELKERIQFLLDVGLGYLSLDRQAKTLSGGESQRIRLATQIGSQLMGITYILDEPSIGLHQRDNERLIQSLKRISTNGEFRSGSGTR